MGAAMYVCLCNGFTDRAVREALAGGAGSVAHVYRQLGCQPQCGKCGIHIRGMLREKAILAATERRGVVGEVTNERRPEGPPASQQGPAERAHGDQPVLSALPHAEELGSR